jgi:hypothetical protein
MSFEQATFQCQHIGAKLPEILTNTDQQALANRKVSFNLKQVQPKDTIYVIVLNSLKINSLCSEIFKMMKTL